MALLLIASAIFVIKCAQESFIGEQLRAVYDVFTWLGVYGIPREYFDLYRDGNTPTRIFIEFYDQSSELWIKIQLDGHFILYEGKVRGSCFNEAGQVHCTEECHLVGTFDFKLLKSYKSRIIIHVKKFLPGGALTDMKKQLEHALMLLNYIPAVLPGPVRDVVITKTLKRSSPNSKIRYWSKVTVNGVRLYSRLQPFTFFNRLGLRNCPNCRL